MNEPEKIEPAEEPSTTAGRLAAELGVVGVPVSGPLPVQPVCLCGHRYDHHNHVTGHCYHCRSADPCLLC